MGLFKKKAQKQVPGYDPDIHKPVIRCSICTGEQIAGFKNLATGKFTEVILIRNESDLESFMKDYGLKSIEKEY